MNISEDEAIIVALSPNSWAAKTTVTEAVKFARLNIQWHLLPRGMGEANITVYLCHNETRLDPDTGALIFPTEQKPILLDTVTIQRPIKKHKRRLN